MTETLTWALVYLLLSWLYIPLSRRPVKYYWSATIDKKIPLISIMIVPYLSYYLFFLAGTIVLIFSRVGIDFLVAMILAQIAADIFWYIFPNGVHRPVVRGDGWAEKLVCQLYRHNTEDANGVPSAHVFHTVIVGYYLILLWPVAAWVLTVWSGLIIVSTILVKQHYLIDVFAGILLAAAALIV